MVVQPFRFHCQLQCSHQRAGSTSGNLLRCKSENGRSSLFKRKFLSKKMVTKGAYSTSSHKSIRDPCSSRRFVSGSTWRCCEDSHRLSNGGFLHQEARGDKKFHFKPRGLSALERCSVKKPDNSDSTLAINKTKCDGGLSVKTPVSSVGVPVIVQRVPAGSGSLPHQPNSGHLRLQGDQDVTQVHDLVPRPGGSRKRCIIAQMGPGVICFSTSSTHPEVAPEAREGEDQSGDDPPTLAVSTVVAPGTESIDRPHPTPAQLQVNTDHGGQPPGPAIPSTSGGCPSTGKNLNFTSDRDLDKFLANPLAGSTQRCYNSNFSKFTSYFSSKNINPGLVVIFGF